MARNAEKAQSMLNRFIDTKKRGPGAEEGATADDRPAPRRVATLRDTERYRLLCVKEVAQKIIDVQDGSIGESAVRSLNDEINVLLKEKARWEKRIVELGGRDYRKTAPKIADIDGKAIRVQGSDYIYFGAARELPGVDDFLKKPKDNEEGESMDVLHNRVDMAYFGFVPQDEEDRLSTLESVVEKARILEMQQEWDTEQEARQQQELDRQGQRESNEADLLAAKKRALLQRLATME